MRDIFMVDGTDISKETWREISEILKKYKIPYTTHYKSKDIQRAMECSDLTVTNKHIQINLVISNYFEEE
jgi:hypothetical protein